MNVPVAGPEDMQLILSGSGTGAWHPVPLSRRVDAPGSPPRPVLASLRALRSRACGIMPRRAGGPWIERRAAEWVPWWRLAKAVNTARAERAQDPVQAIGILRVG